MQYEKLLTPNTQKRGGRPIRGGKASPSSLKGTALSFWGEKRRKKKEGKGSSDISSHRQSSLEKKRGKGRGGGIEGERFSPLSRRGPFAGKGKKAGRKERTCWPFRGAGKKTAHVVV